MRPSPGVVAAGVKLVCWAEAAGAARAISKLVVKTRRGHGYFSPSRTGVKPALRTGLFQQEYIGQRAIRVHRHLASAHINLHILDAGEPLQFMRDIVRVSWGKTCLSRSACRTSCSFGSRWLLRTCCPSARRRQPTMRLRGESVSSSYCVWNFRNDQSKRRSFADYSCQTQRAAGSGGPRSGPGETGSLRTTLRGGVIGRAASTWIPFSRVRLAVVAVPWCLGEFVRCPCGSVAPAAAGRFDQTRAGMLIHVAQYSLHTAVVVSPSWLPSRWLQPEEAR